MVIGGHLLDAVEVSSAGDDDVAELTSRACVMLERAAARASSIGAPAEAQRLLESALARTNDPLEQARFSLAASQAAQSAGRYPAGAEHAVEATRLFDQLALPIDAGMAAAEHGRSLQRLQDNATAAEIAQPRWDALQGDPAANGALLLLAWVLESAARAQGDLEKMGYYAERRVLLAEALNDPESLAGVHSSMGIRYLTAGAPVTARVMFESMAVLARKHDLIAMLARALNNLSAIGMSRDLSAALQFAREGMEVARRSGEAELIDMTALNYLMALWTSGRLDEARSVLAAAFESVADPGNALCLESIQGWFADACGRPMPAGGGAQTTDNAAELAWLANLDLVRARANGDLAGAARISEGALPHLLAGLGIEDDFMHLWPPMVQAAVDAGDAALAEKLLEPVDSAATGILSPAVAAQLHRMRGLIGSARGDEPITVEAELRAEIAALDAYGAVPARARAEEELAYWLIAQQRRDEAEPLLAHARATYAEIGATAWLAALDARTTIAVS